MCTPSGAMGFEVSWRVGRTRAAYHVIAGHFFGASAYSLLCKKRVTATLLQTRLLYSSETWPQLPVVHTKRLKRVQMNWTRQAVKRHRGEGCRETDAQIRAEFSISTVESKITLRRLVFVVAAAHGLSLVSCAPRRLSETWSCKQCSRRYQQCRIQWVTSTRG